MTTTALHGELSGEQVKEFLSGLIVPEGAKFDPLRLELASRYIGFRKATGNNPNQWVLDIASENLGLSEKEALESLVKEQWDFAPHRVPVINFRRRQPLAEPEGLTPAARKPLISGFGIKPQRKPLAGVKNIIAVYSGKGGVGKSTVSCFLAKGLRILGYSVGILDADLHGPSIPHLLGVHGALQVTNHEKMIPKVSDGIQVMSFGFFLDKVTPFMSRGPVVTKSLQTLMGATLWSELDYLVIDLPPGTGDIPISLLESLDIQGAVIVSTPQEIALLDAHKGLSLFEKLEVPVLGFIENMSMYTCPHCGQQDHVFGQSSEEFASDRCVTILSRIPLKRIYADDAILKLPIDQVDQETLLLWETMAGRIVDAL